MRQLLLQRAMAQAVLGQGVGICVCLGLREPSFDPAQLLLEGLDLPLEAGRLARLALRRPGRRRLGLAASASRAPSRRSTAGSWSRAYSPNAPSRSRSRPSSIAIVRVASASISARSCETSRMVPEYSVSASSSASRLSMSRWLVGSSSTRKFAPDTTTRASASRRRSPPESTSTGFSTCSPENRKRPSRSRACGPVSGGALHHRVDQPEVLGQLDRVLRVVGDGHVVPDLHPPGLGRRVAQDRLDQRGLAGAVAPDQRDALARARWRSRRR